MPRMRKIVQRLKAVRSIRTVTKTMEMVAAARLRRSHQHALSMGRYARSMMGVVADLLRRSGAIEHPLLQSHPERPLVLLVLTSDRGLCGGYNTTVLSLAMNRLGQLLKEGRQVRLRAVGRRGLQYFRFSGFDLDASYDTAELGRPARGPNRQAVSRLADGIIQEFRDGRIGGLEVAYVRFMSSGRQHPAVAQILPVTGLEEQEAPEQRLVLGDVPQYEFMGDPTELLEVFLPEAARVRMFQVCLDASVSEQAMRMAAMRGGTENADQMIRRLLRQHNRLRQSQVTTELAEIMAGGGPAEGAGGLASSLRRRLEDMLAEATVTVTSAAPLEEPQRVRIERALREALGPDIRVRTRVDERITGGLVVRMGDTVVDASIAGGLRRWRDDVLRRGPAEASPDGAMHGGQEP